MGRCGRGGTCHNDKPGLKGGNDGWMGIRMGGKLIGEVG